MNEEDEWEDVEWEKEMKSCKSGSMRKHFKWRTLLSIITGFGWLIFLVVWLFFHASNYTIYQNLGVLLASMIALFVINGSVWKSIDEENKWKSAFSTVSGLLFGIFLVTWLFYYASDYTLISNIGVFFLSVLVIAAVNSLIWIPKRSSIGWRAAVSAVSGLGWIIFLVYWFLIGSSAYNIYQNLAIFIVSILVLAAVNVVTWLSWGLKKAGVFKKGY